VCEHWSHITKDYLVGEVGSFFARYSLLYLHILLMTLGLFISYVTTEIDFYNKYCIINTNTKYLKGIYIGTSP